jgi:hypothetical protein
MEDGRNLSRREGKKPSSTGTHFSLSLFPSCLILSSKELPIFSLRHLDWVIKAPASSRGIKRSQRIITKVVVNNNIFIFGTSDGVILRWNIESGGESEEIEIAKKPEVSSSLFSSLLTLDSCSPSLPHTSPLIRISFTTSSLTPQVTMSSLV